jgi:hypothetical protein
VTPIPPEIRSTGSSLWLRAVVLATSQIARLRGARPAGPAPQPRTEPTVVQRRASNTGIIMVVGQKVALGRVHARKTVTVEITDTELLVQCDDGIKTVRRNGNQPIRNLKASRPRTTSQPAGDATSNGEGA